MAGEVVEVAVATEVVGALMREVAMEEEKMEAKVVVMARVMVEAEAMVVAKVAEKATPPTDYGQV